MRTYCERPAAVAGYRAATKHSNIVANSRQYGRKSANHAAVSPWSDLQDWLKRDQFDNPSGIASLRSPGLPIKQAMTAGAAWLYPGN